MCGEVDEQDIDNSTYKEYDLTPNFDKDTLQYELTLLEYLDNMDITATKSNENSSMKIKIPKRNDGNLIYDTDGITILYEEKEIQNMAPFEITLNKLGEPDTKITVIVTAEDEVTTKEYEITIKRPYGTLKGQVYTSPTAATGIYKSDIRLYSSSEVSTIIDWFAVVSGTTDDIHDKLLTLNSQNYVTNDDGTYEMYVIPGTYDILLDKSGYLDHIYTSKQVVEGAVVDLGNKELYAGDVNKDGSIQIADLSLLMSVFGTTQADSDYDAKYDFNDDLEIQIADLSVLMANFSMSETIE